MQVPATRWTVYFTEPSVLSVFVSVWTIGFPEPSLKPVIFPDARLAVHVKAAFRQLAVNVILVVCSEQRVSLMGLFVRCGCGLMTTITSNVGPLQLLATGVTVYVTVSTTIPGVVNV